MDSTVTILPDRRACPGCAFGLDLGPVLAALVEAGELLDAEASFPAEALAALAGAGALAAPVPPDLGGRGLGTAECGTQGIFELLSALGHANLSLGRVFEAHVNALRLIWKYGAAPQIERAFAQAREGHLFGLWITDRSDAPVRLKSGILEGQKAFVSSVGVASRALITFDASDQGERMAVIDLVANQVETVANFDLHGVRSAATARVDLSGVRVAEEDIVGVPGDYMRDPELSLGAWRALAVMHGGLVALVEALGAALLLRGRDGDPHQRARLGQALVAQETATLWIRRCAALAEADHAGEPAANYVKLARIAVERACVEVMNLAQRSVGVAAMVRPNTIERLCRDLNTYLRQPALDMVLDEAAAFFIRGKMP